ncbi:MAG: GntR family transcriptional regulator [Gammaproteobacteria bacterium]|nr:GntR family transcriptional regulator [Gammaproteobacteria bacterium]
MSKKQPAGITPKKLTVVEQAAHEIRQRIRDGRVVPGQRLIEAELTEDLGISRGPLREALWRLSGEGLVTIEPNKGVSVKRLNREEVLNIYAIREMLEGLAARLAAQHINEGDNLKRLKIAKNDTVKLEHSLDVTSYMQANEAFHDTIVILSGNEQLGDLIAQLRWPLFRIQFKQVLTGSGSTSQSVKDHKDIFNAIKTGDPARAERAMRRHICHSADAVKRLNDPELV